MGQISVLVVDDSAFMRRAIATMIEKEPDMMVTATARSGEEAITKALQLNPDVITMDVEMPGMGGLEAVRQIVADHRIPARSLPSRSCTPRRRWNSLRGS
jgi:two-component system chemotaxis response regulator CheB